MSGDRRLIRMNPLSPDRGITGRSRKGVQPEYGMLQLRRRQRIGPSPHWGGGPIRACSSGSDVRPPVDLVGSSEECLCELPGVFKVDPHAFPVSPSANS